MRYVLTFLTLSLTLTTARADDDTIKKELEKFQGKWQILEHRKGDRSTTKEEAKKMSATITGKNLTITSPNDFSECTFTINPSAKPAAIDLFDKGRDKEPLPAIYKFEQDTLTIFYTDDLQAPRLKDFTPTKANSSLIMERVKK